MRNPETTPVELETSFSSEFPTDPIDVGRISDRLDASLRARGAKSGRDRTPQVTILGGGPAGLAAAFYARRAGLTCSVLEAGEGIGGNARTLQHGEFLFDSGAHRFHDKDPQITRDILELMGSELVSTERPSQIIFGTRRIDFPLSPFNLIQRLGPRMTAAAARDFLRERFHSLPENPTFEDLTVHRYGRTIAKAFLLDYSAKLWSVSADRLSPAVSGQRLKGLDIRTFVVEAIRGKKAKTAHLDGRFYYPRWGIGQLMDRLAKSCGLGTIRTRARVTRLFHDGIRIHAVQINSREKIAVKQVVSSLPLTALVTAMDPALPDSVRAEVRKLRFRHVMLVALYLNCPRVSHNASFYFPEAHIPFTRAFEPKNRSEMLAPADRTSLIVEIPCSTDDAVWQSNSENLVRMVIQHLEEKQLIRASDVFDSSVHCMPFAYPILETGFQTTVGNVLDYFSRFENLHIIGRSGLFAYTHIHNLLIEGRDLTAELVRTAVPVEL